ncbi:MAG: hypothetical protein SOI15_02875 [Bifidobacterium crudilactis]
MNEADEFSLAVIEEVQEAIKASGKSNAEVIKQAKISQDYFYTRMRGEKPFNTNDLSRIADVIGIDALSLLMNASKAIEKAKVSFNPDVMSEEEKKQWTLDHMEDYGFAANTNPNKEQEMKNDGTI